MRLHVDESIGALYLRLTQAAVVESEEVHPDVILNYDEQGTVVGIELLGLKDRNPVVELRRLEFGVE